MPAGTFSILPGTPITPGVGEVIEYYGVPMTITLSDPVGVSWSNNGTQPPPVRPGTTSTTPPPTYFDPAITRTDTDIRAEVWDQTNTTKIGDLSYSAARQFLDEYNGVGSGNLKVPADVVGAGAELLRRDRVVRFYYKDIPDAVFASIVEGRKTAVIAEAGSNWTEITGRGTLAWLEDAVVLPYVDSSDLPLSSTGISVASDGTRTVVESNLQETSPDVRAFNFGSRDAWKHVLFDDTGSGSGGSDPGLTATWTMPVGVKYTNRTDIVKGNPVKWPDKTAYWIWPTNPQADVKDGLNAYFRESFYISVAMDVYVHVTADNYSWFYIDGVQIGTSVNFMGVDQPHAWTRRLVHLEPGVHFFQARVQNANTPAVKYNPAGLLMAITRVSDGAMITHSAPTVAWEVTLTKVSFATNAADVGPGWHRPLGVKQSVKKPLNLKEYFPVDWPDGNAKWIWGSDPTTTSPPEQVCYFRAKVWIEQTGTYRWFCTADDGHVTWIDGIEVASLGYEGTAASGWQRSDEVDVDLVAGWHVFSMRGQNQTNSNIHNARGNPAAVLGTLMKIDKNGKPSTVVPDVHTDSVGIRADMGWYANWVCPAWKAGDVLLTLLEEAQARGVTRLLGVQVDFNRDTDSNGQPWTTRVSRTWDIGTSLLKVAFDLCELGVDIWMTPDNYLHCAEKRGTSDPTFSILYGVNVTGYDVDETFAGASVAYTRTRTGWFTLTNETSQLILGGKRETGISLANTDSEDAMVGLSHRAIGAVVMANMVATAGAIVPVPGSIPWVDAGIGDLIYVLAPNGGQRMGRLLSISVGENEAGATTWVPEIEIWSSPFGDGVDPTKPQDPVDPNNPFDPSTWVPAAEDWTRFIPGSSSATGDYAKRVTLAEADAMVAGENPGYYGTPGPSPSPSGATPTPANSAPHPRPAPNSLNKKTPPNAERVHVADAEPLTTSGFHLWVDTSGVV
jgi:hypothetical protein